MKRGEKRGGNLKLPRLVFDIMPEHSCGIIPLKVRVKDDARSHQSITRIIATDSHLKWCEKSSVLYLAKKGKMGAVESSTAGWRSHSLNGTEWNTRRISCWNLCGGRWSFSLCIFSWFAGTTEPHSWRTGRLNSRQVVMGGHSPALALTPVRNRKKIPMTY